MKFKVGDKVKIARKTDGWGGDGLMDKWLGKIMTVDSISSVGYFMKEDSGENGGWGWCWSEKCLEPYQFTKADLKPCMVVELRNGEMAIIGQFDEGLSVDWRNGCQSLGLNDYEEDLKYGGGMYDIVKVYGFSNRAHRTTEATKSERELLWERIEKSPQQIKLEKLENKQREIAGEIRKIKEEM